MPLTKKAERTKAKLTASARKLISERGFDNVSVEEITKDAGVAKGTFYHYFVCKEDVVREFSTRVIEEIFTTAMTMPGGPQEKLTYYFNAILHEADRMGVNLIRQWIRDIMSPRSAEEGAENLREGYRKIYTILKPHQRRKPAERRYTGRVPYETSSLPSLRCAHHMVHVGRLFQAERRIQPVRHGRSQCLPL